MDGTANNSPVFGHTVFTHFSKSLMAKRIDRMSFKHRAPSVNSIAVKVIEKELLNK
jgi:hypothetical protein